MHNVISNQRREKIRQKNVLVKKHFIYKIEGNKDNSNLILVFSKINKSTEYFHNYNYITNSFSSTE